MRNLTSLFFLAGIGIATSTFAQNVPINFGGDATLGNIHVTNTDTSLAGSAVAPTLTPETDAPTANNLSNGFSVTGRFDFVNGTGASAELTFTASRPVSLSSTNLTTSASEDGFFGLESTDAGMVGTGVPAAGTEHLDSFTTRTWIQSTDATPVILSGSSVSATDGGETIPVTLTEFPTNSTESTAGPNSIGPFTAATNNYTLFQTVDIKISGLLPSEAIDIDLPTVSTIGVPEPTSATILLSSIALLASKRRRFLV